MESPCLRLALQKSGRLSEQSLDLLRRAGIRLEMSKNQLLCRAQNFPLEIHFVRDDDIPAFVGQGVCGIGIVGQNVLIEEQEDPYSKGLSSLQTVLELGFGRCRLSLAVPHDVDYDGPESMEGKSIATSYRGVLKQYLRDRGISSQIVDMRGSVEIAPRVKLADAVCDLVSTGATLAANGLREVETILESQAVLIRNDNLSPEEEALLERLLTRFNGVLQAGNSKYIMLHAPLSVVDDIKAILPGTESPTILHIHGDEERVAIHAVCRESVFWDTMEDIKRVGGSSILVLPIEKMMA